MLSVLASAFVPGIDSVEVEFDPMLTPMFEGIGRVLVSLRVPFAPRGAAVRDGNACWMVVVLVVVVVVIVVVHGGCAWVPSG